MPRNHTKDFPELWPDEFREHAVGLGEGNPLLRIGERDESELLPDPDGMANPTGETGGAGTPHLLQKYKDRALWLATSECFFNCRFCFRRAKRGGEPSRVDLSAAKKHLQNNPQVAELIFSGGDPLTMSDDGLKKLVEFFGGVESVKTFRLHTRAPVVNPGRVTKKLATLLAQSPKPFKVVIHAAHPLEIRKPFLDGLAMLMERDIPVMNQTVLLGGVNDSPQTLGELFGGLSGHGVKTKYLHHPDRVMGAAHFRVPIARGLSLYRELKGFCEAPPYVLDLPCGAGKTPVGALTPVAQRSQGATRRRLYRWVRPGDWQGLSDIDRAEWWDIEERLP